MDERDINCNLASLISPHSIEDFFQTYYEQKYLYISRNKPDYYKAILNTEDIDLFFQNKNLQSSFLRVVNKGEDLYQHKWTIKNTTAVDNDKLYVLFNQGHTLVINSGERSILKLTKYCSALERELNLRLQFNIYITPHNAQGFTPHFDDHDVFILQTMGTKVWRLYNTPIELPSKKFPHHKYRDKYELRQPKFEVELKPGDLLYIPRGMVHDASTTDTASVHITLGLHPNYWFELVQELAEIAEEKLEFRKAVPNTFTSEHSRQEFKEEFQKLIQALMDNLNVDELWSRRFDKYITSKTSEDQNRFKDSIQINKLNLNSILSRRVDTFYKIDKDSEKIYVSFYGKKIDFPLFLSHSITTLLNSKSFAVKDIGGLINDEGRIDLATIFIQEGFLTIEKISGDTL